MSQQMTAVRARALLQQNSVAHYRRALYTWLGREPELRYEFVFGSEEDTPYLRALAPSELEGSCHSARVLRLGADWVWQPGAIREAFRGRYDAVIALGSPYSLTAWALLLTRVAHGAKVLLWTHGLLKQESGPKWWIRRTFYKSADGLLLYGDRARALLLDAGFAEERLHVIYNGLDSALLEQCLQNSLALGIAQARAAVGCEEAERVLLFTGRLVVRKQLSLLVEAVQQLRQEGLPVHALLVGEGDAELQLRELAARLGVSECIHFLGACHDEERNALYFRAADACVIPEAAGLAVNHALAFRTPVVTHADFDHQFPEVEALVAGKTGVFFERGNLADLKKALYRALYPTGRAGRSLKETLAPREFAPAVQRYGAAQQARLMSQAVMRTVRPHR